MSVACYAKAPYEQTLPKKKKVTIDAIRAREKNKLAYAPKPKIPPPPKREDPAKDSICHECGDTGYWKRNCPQYLAELLKKKKNTASGADGSGIFTIELNNFLNRSWIYDTGCGTHICNTMQGLRESRKLKAGTLSLYMGNGQREAVEAMILGEYMSQEFLDHLKDHGIIAHRTPSYTPQHNGASERRNRTLLDMVRSMMSQTSLPKSFWDYALETATRILNMVPTKKVEKTPYKVWHGQAC
ncbi:zinc finger, CCHC-type containing protein [Tanacetum coccineum]